MKKVTVENKVVGKIYGQSYIRDIKQEHFCRKHIGYGIQSSILPELALSGIREVVLVGDCYELHSSFRDWAINGIEDDLGAGKQTFLGVQFMKKVITENGSTRMVEQAQNWQQNEQCAKEVQRAHLPLNFRS